MAGCLLCRWYPPWEDAENLLRRLNAEYDARCDLPQPVVDPAVVSFALVKSGHATEEHVTARQQMHWLLCWLRGCCIEDVACF